MKNSLYIIFFSLLTGLISNNLHAQEYSNDPEQHSKDLDEIAKNSQLVELFVIDGDTIPMVVLPTVYLTERKFDNEMDKQKFYRMKRLVKKVYPYAINAADIMGEIEKETELIAKKRKEKKYLKQLEKDLKEEFEDPLKNLTTSQGKVLIKIIERNTGKSMHQMIKDYKSGFSAFMFNQIGKRFGYNLKDGYNPDDKDFEYLEEIVQEIEMNGWEVYNGMR